RDRDVGAGGAEPHRGGDRVPPRVVGRVSRGPGSSRSERSGPTRYRGDEVVTSEPGNHLGGTSMRYFVLGDAAPAGTISARRSTAGTKGRRRPHRREFRLEAMEPRQLLAGVPYAHSANVAVIGDPFTNDGSIDIEPVNNGGHLPLGGGDFAAFHFTHLAPA